MAYRIRYPGSNRMSGKETIKIQILAIAGLLCLFLLGGQIFRLAVKGYETCDRWDSFRETMVRHCREKLIQAGVYE